MSNMRFCQLWKTSKVKTTVFEALSVASQKLHEDVKHTNNQSVTTIQTNVVPEVSEIEHSGLSLKKHGRSVQTDNDKLTRYRHSHPEFLPDPNPIYRNELREHLERMDMIARRSKILIPEFYVGSILAVVHSEPHAPSKTNRFVGICIEREGSGLRANFILRNVVDDQAVEMRYALYDPCLQSVECLKLEKRLDSQLLYLRDAPLKYSTFPFDMEPIYLREGDPIVVNPIKVKLNPRPWFQKWELYNLKGVEDLMPMLNENRKRKFEKNRKPWEKYDLMKMYRASIPQETQVDIYKELDEAFKREQREIRRKSRIVIK